MYHLVADCFALKRTPYYRGVAQSHRWIGRDTSLFAPLIARIPSGDAYQDLKIEIRAWLFATIGPHNRAGHRWVDVGGEFILQDRDDALQFRLRWC